MEKGCPFLRMAYIIAKALEKRDTVNSVKVTDARRMDTYCALPVTIKDARCMDMYCALYDKCQGKGKGNADKI